MTVDGLIKELQKYPRDMQISVKGGELLALEPRGVSGPMDGFTPDIKKIVWVQDNSERLLITKGRWEWYQNT